MDSRGSAVCALSNIHFARAGTGAGTIAAVRGDAQTPRRERGIKVLPQVNEQEMT